MYRRSHQKFYGNPSIHDVDCATAIRTPAYNLYSEDHACELAADTMRVLVGVKRVVDYAVKVRIQPDKAGEHRQRNNENAHPAAVLR